jgi:outer membrane immunogenic protein
VKMKFLLIAAASSIAGSALAQSASEGFYGQISTGYESASVGSGRPTISGSGYTYTGSATGTASASSAPIVVGLGYNWALDDGWTLGLGFDYSTVSQDTGSKTSDFGSQGSIGVVGSFFYRLSKRYNLALTPGFKIGDGNQVAYLKAGYSNETIQALVSTGAAQSNSSAAGGYVLGLGYKQFLSGGMYWLAEAGYYGYSKPSLSSVTGTGPKFSWNVGTPGALNLLVGVGYKF